MSSVVWPLVGHEAEEAAFLSAGERGRLHHAWLVEGPSGIGKAQLARRLSAWLLGAKSQGGQRYDPVDTDPVVQKILAGSHPDFRWVAREPNENGKLPQFISVDTVRSDVVGFFTHKPALGGYRVCVIDSIDELNASGANALLKTLEEPPPDCVLFLISHGTRTVLPTIRSRCRRLRLDRLSTDEVKQVLEQQDVEIGDEAIALADGRPGRAIQLASAEALSAARTARHIVEGLPRLSDSALGDALQAATKGAAAYEALTSGLLTWVESEAERDPQRAPDWFWMSNTLAQARTDMMDPVQTLAKLITGLQERYASR